MIAIRQVLIAAILCAGVTMQPSAASAQVRYTSPGDLPCAAGLASMKDAAGFIDGYMSATNDAGGRVNIYGQLTVIGALIWIARWCDENPRQKVGDALRALTQSALSGDVNAPWDWLNKDGPAPRSYRFLSPSPEFPS